MIDIKTEEELRAMAEGGKILAEVLDEVVGSVAPGVSEKDLDNLADKFILEKGGKPGFKKVKGYRNAICASTNDVVVHGIPTDYKFRPGDVVGVDCGVFYKGFHTDMSETVRVQNSKREKDEIDKFLEVGKKALNAAIKVAVEGNRVGDISKAIQNIIEVENGYSIVRTLVGHGVGRKLHEEPEVPGFLEGSIEETPKLVNGMTIAIEVIYNMGKPDVTLDSDNWTIRTRDHTVSGVFERTVAIRGQKPWILT